MEADELSSNLWNAIADLVNRNTAPAEITIAKVRKRDVMNKVIWVEEFGDVGIPLVDFTHAFAYYDTLSTGAVDKRYDASGDDSDPAYHVKLVVPRIGETVAILNPRGNGRFPICVGVMRSKLGKYWTGE